MTADQWARIRELFVLTHELQPGDRQRLLDDMCSTDPALRSEVESLLASHDSAGAFFGPIEENILAGAVENLHPDKRIGTLVGSYRIVRQIAYGGMGEVYEAVRDDGSFRKRVAIKLVRSGFSQTEMARRFQAERQMLASLQHPNIAQLIDAGTTADGVPYLMMEFIDGKRIDEYSDEHGLSIKERLTMFRTVCAAVQFAHQHLVVHRDIKPGNILVTDDGTPKLLDFGIATLVTEETAGEDATRTGASFMTPEYASPEQARGDKVTTISDVYSLGVLLYKLLTGQKPYEFTSTLHFEISRTIIDTEPTRPSSKRSGIRVQDSNPEKVQRALAGDIDAIVLKALRKEPPLRYQTAQEFSDDIRRYLEGFPVTARTDAFGYTLGKFVRRNKLGVIAVAVILAILFGALATTLYQIRMVRLEKEKAENINEFMKEMLIHTNPIKMLHRKTMGGTTMTEMLDEAARRLDGGEFDNQPDVKAEIEHMIGESYGSQGKYDLSTKYQEKFIEHQLQLHGENDPTTLEATSLWATLLFRKGEFAKAEGIFRHIVPLMRKKYDAGSLKAAPLAETMNELAYLRRTQGDSKEAEALFREALELMPFIAEEDRYLLSLARSTLASTLADQGRFEDALATAREAVSESRRNGFVGTPDYGYTLTVLGGFLTDAGSYAEADDTLRSAEAIFRKLLTPEHLWLGDNLRNQGISLYIQGRYASALPKVVEAISIYLKSFGKLYDHYPTCLSTEGLILAKTGNAAAGEKLLREAVDIRTTTLPQGHYMTALAKGALGECLTLQRRFAEAEPLLLDSYDSLRKSQGPQNHRTLLAERRLNDLYRNWNKPAIAIRYKPH